MSDGPMSDGPMTERTPRVVAAAKLTRRARRDESSTFLAEGPQAVREALAGPGAVVELFVTGESRARHEDLVRKAAGAGVPVRLGTDRALAGLSETTRPQGIVAVCAFLDLGLDAGLAAATASTPVLLAVLADVRDPGNAGTVLRCADAAGAGAVIFAGDSVDPYNGKAVRASAGSLFHVPVVRGAAVVATLDAVRRCGAQVLAADGRGADDLEDLADDGLLAGKTAWLFGNEAHGLDHAVAGLADRRVRVPIHGRAESLNLATAAAVCLYASARAQRRTTGAAGRRTAADRAPGGPAKGT